MSQKQNEIANIKLQAECATELTFHELYTWVIWQFPHKKAGGLCGAVHPPITSYGWLPAIINIKDKQAQVYAHLNQIFPSPEAAIEHLAEHLAQQPSKKA